jgi:hypothetical protein
VSETGRSVTRSLAISPMVRLDPPSGRLQADAEANWFSTRSGASRQPKPVSLSVNLPLHSHEGGSADDRYRVNLGCPVRVGGRPSGQIDITLTWLFFQTRSAAEVRLAGTMCGNFGNRTHRGVPKDQRLRPCTAVKCESWWYVGRRLTTKDDSSREPGIDPDRAFMAGGFSEARK